MVDRLSGLFSPSDASKALSITTSFSGIAAPEMGLRMLAHYVGKKTSKPTHFTVQGAVDWNEHSRAELLWNPSCMRPQHIWVDQNEFINDFIRGTVLAKASAGASMETLWEFVTAPNVVGATAECQVCGGHCAMMQSSFHCAGSPCIDYSTIPGALQQRDCGSTLLPTLVWAALCRQLGHHIIIHENVESFPVSMLEFMFQDLYMIMTAILNLVALGFPCRRRRRITIMIHKKVVRLPTAFWSDAWIQRYHRQLAISFRKFLFATSQELEKELAWARKRTNLGKDSDKYTNAPDIQRSRFVQVLTLWEIENLRKYRKRWPGCAYMLGQDAIKAPARSDRLAMMCETKSQDLIFSDEDERWLVPKELLVFQGWPLYEPLKEVIDISCCFDEDRPGRKPDRMHEQAGNSIPLPMTTLALLYCLVETDVGATEETPMASLLHAALAAAVLGQPSSSASSAAPPSCSSTSTAGSSAMSTAASSSTSVPTEASGPRRKRPRTLREALSGESP